MGHFAHILVTRMQTHHPILTEEQLLAGVRHNPYSQYRHWWISYRGCHYNIVDTLRESPQIQFAHYNAVYDDDCNIYLSGYIQLDFKRSSNCISYLFPEETELYPTLYHIYREYVQYADPASETTGADAIKSLSRSRHRSAYAQVLKQQKLEEFYSEVPYDGLTARQFLMLSPPNSP